MLNRFNTGVALIVGLICCVADAADEENTFLPGQVWTDTDGKPIQAHGGGILFYGNKWWWYGEDRSDGYVAIGVSGYVSTDLVNWKHLGVVLPRSAYDRKHGGQTICERPKVIFNPKSQQFVMWFHYDRSGYGDSRAGVAVASRPEGPFKFFGTGRPIPKSTFRDMNLFVDDDGRAYVFYAGEDNLTLHVIRLDWSWTGPEMPMVKGKTWDRVLIRDHREAPAPFKYKGKYYVMVSRATGWDPNPADVAVADKPLGPYTLLGNPCVGFAANTTFQTQSTFIFPMPGAPGKFIYMGDRWKRDDLAASRYVWLPFEMKADRFALEWTPEWKLEGPATRRTERR